MLARYGLACLSVCLLQVDVLLKRLYVARTQYRFVVDLWTTCCKLSILGVFQDVEETQVDSVRLLHYVQPL